MGTLTRIYDGLRNVVANLGTSRDKAAHSVYTLDVMSAHERQTMYRSSWTARAIVDYPAEDATRNWRVWRAEADQISKIEAEEKRLDLQRITLAALKAARLYGWSVIFINTADQDASLPLQPGTEILSLIPLTPDIVTLGELSRDVTGPYFGRPEFYTISTNANPLKIHASRMCLFTGADIPASPLTLTVLGDSVLQCCIDPVRQLDATCANTESLVYEAKVDVLKFDGLADLLEQGGDDALISRLTVQAAMKGVNGVLVIDAKDDYLQKSASFAGLTEVIQKQMELVAGSAGIPITRLFGRAVAALSGSGEGDERVYFDRVKADQANKITPAINWMSASSPAHWAPDRLKSGMNGHRCANSRITTRRSC